MDMSFEKSAMSGFMGKLGMRGYPSAALVSPKGKVVWRLQRLTSPSDADRLPNGTTMVAENGSVRIFSSDGREVWRKPVTWAIEVNLTPVRRPDDAQAARHLIATWFMDDEGA